MPHFHTDFMWPETWEQRESKFSRRSNQRASCLGDSKSLMVCEAWMICLRRPPFQREDIAFVLMSLHMAYHIEDHQNITSCRKNPWEKLQALPTGVCCTSIKAQRERKESEGEESWKPLVFLQSANRPLDSVRGPGIWIRLWRWSLLQVRLKMKD